MIDNNSFRVIKRREFEEIHIQFIPNSGESPNSFSERIAEIVENYNAKIIRATFFGKLTEEEKTIKCFSDVLHGVDFPYSWIEGDDCTDSFINGVYVLAVSGIEVIRLYEQKRVIGSFFQTTKAQFCYLGGLCSNPDLSPDLQTSTILDRAEKYLKQIGLSYLHTIRTWFYLDNILNWYKEFNLARTAFFNQNGIFNKLVPASTGIGGKNNSGSKICLELNAIKPKSHDFSVLKVISPLQCPAENYGSSFSRAVSYSDGEYTTLTVSGTASVNREGHTEYIGDFLKQAEMTFNVVETLLVSQGFEFGDAVRCYVYVSDKSFYKTLIEFFKTRMTGVPSFICSANRICRENLLVEIELDAIKKSL